MCDFKYFVPNVACKLQSRKLEGLFILKDCNRCTLNHLKSLNLLVLNANFVPNECQLILNRAELPDIESLHTLKICSHHRNELGIFYYAKKNVKVRSIRMIQKQSIKI